VLAVLVTACGGWQSICRVAVVIVVVAL
jgi:hypothetical protein